MPGGRPSKFDDVDMGMVQKFCECGMTDIQICQFLDISEQTLTNWKKAHPEFFGSIKDWKIKADENVSKSLYQRAHGYTCMESKTVIVDGQVKIVTLLKHYPPDPTSMIFWLKNRQKDKWRDTHTHEHSGDITFKLAEKIKSSRQRMEVSKN